MLVEGLLEQINKGREGSNWGLPMGLPRLEQYIDGVSKSTYTLLFSGSGVGKTSLALYAYIYRPIMDCIERGNDKLKILYISLEMKGEVLLAKLLSTYIFETYGVEISYKEMVSKTRGKVLSDKEYELIEKSVPWLAEVEKRLIIYDKALTAAAFSKLLTSLAEKFGTFKEDSTRRIYQANDPDMIMEVVVDHLSLTTPTAGNSLKTEMDNISKIAVNFRNTCSFSFLMLMQVNRDSSNVERRKLELLEPQRSDVKDSGNMEQDCDLMVSIFNPHREKLKSYRGYDISTLGSNFRAILLLKSRYGDGDVSVGCNYFGKSNIWKELPKADQIYDYERYTTIDTYKKQTEEIKNEELDLNYKNNIEIIL